MRRAFSPGVGPVGLHGRHVQGFDDALLRVGQDHQLAVAGQFEAREDGVLRSILRPGRAVDHQPVPGGHGYVAEHESPAQIRVVREHPAGEPGLRDAGILQLDPVVVLTVHRVTGRPVAGHHPADAHGRFRGRGLRAAQPLGQTARGQHRQADQDHQEQVPPLLKLFSLAFLGHLYTPGEAAPRSLLLVEDIPHWIVSSPAGEVKGNGCYGGGGGSLRCGYFTIQGLDKTPARVYYN